MIRRTSIRLAIWLSGPDDVAGATFGSAVVAGCGLSGPCAMALPTVRKPVTTIGVIGPLVTLDLRIT